MNRPLDDSDESPSDLELELAYMDVACQESTEGCEGEKLVRIEVDPNLGYAHGYSVMESVNAILQGKPIKNMGVLFRTPVTGDLRVSVNQPLRRDAACVLGYELGAGERLTLQGFNTGVVSCSSVNTWMLVQEIMDEFDDRTTQRFSPFPDELRTMLCLDRYPALASAFWTQVAGRVASNLTAFDRFAEGRGACEMLLTSVEWTPLPQISDLFGRSEIKVSARTEGRPTLSKSGRAHIVPCAVTVKNGHKRVGEGKFHIGIPTSN